MKRIICVCIFAEFIQTEMYMHCFIYIALYYLVLSVICLYIVFPQSPVGLLELNKLTYLYEEPGPKKQDYKDRF